MRWGIVTYLVTYGVTLLIRECVMIGFAIVNPEWIDKDSFEQYGPI